MTYKELLAKVPENLKDISQLRMVGMRRHGRLFMGFGLAETVGEHAQTLAPEKKTALVVVDKVLRKLNVHAPVVESLEKAGYALDFFDEIPPEPHLEDGRKLQEFIRAKDFGVVVGVGGGSTMDIAKAGAMLATNPLDIEKYYTGTPMENAILPLILLPTNSGTGSEVSCTAVMASSERKIFLTDQVLFADLALIDPLLTVSCPPSVTAASGLDALSHGMEGLQALSTPLTRLFGYKCAEYTFKYLPRAVADPYDLEARYYMSFASVYGTFACNMALYAHSMSYILTMDKHVPHGVGCGVALPYTFMYNFDYLKDLLADLANAVDPDKKGTKDELASYMLDRFFLLLKECKMPTSLKDLGVEEEKIAPYADDLFNKYYRPRNPRKMTLEEAHKWVRLMWEGKVELF